MPRVPPLVRPGVFAGPLARFHPGRVAASARLTVPPAPGKPLSGQLRLTPSRVGVGVVNLAPPVTSRLALCVRVGKEGLQRRRGVAGAGRRAGRPCSRPTHEPASPGA